MAQVNITISGKIYRMACDDGQEAHLTALGDRLNQTIEQLRERFGEIGDQRLTVMAAITMADQHSEAERRLRSAEGELTGLHEERAAVAGERDEAELGLATSIERIAARLESIADRLTGGDAGE